MCMVEIKVLVKSNLIKYNLITVCVITGFVANSVSAPLVFPNNHELRWRMGAYLGYVYEGGGG